MFNWIQQFLTERSFKVKVGNEVSESYNIECGVPQGSVISPILFNIMINDIFYGIDLGIGAALYADDGTLWKRGRNIDYITDVLQKAITEVERCP